MESGSLNRATPNVTIYIGHPCRDGGGHRRGEVQPRDQVHVWEVRHKPAVHERGAVYQEELDCQRKATEIPDLGHGGTRKIHVADADVLPERGDYHPGLRRHAGRVIQESRKVDGSAPEQPEGRELHRARGKQDRHAGASDRARRDQRVL